MDEKIINLLYFAICLACWTSPSGDIFNQQKLFKVVELTYSKWHPKSFVKACNSKSWRRNLLQQLSDGVWKPYRHSMISTCKWEETESGAAYHRNSQIPYTQSDW